MPRIINAYQDNEGSLTSALGALAKSFFGENVAQQEVYRQKALELLRQNKSTPLLADALVAGDVSGALRHGVMAGSKGADVAAYHRFGTANRTTDPMDPRVNMAMLGAGDSAASTPWGFDAGLRKAAESEAAKTERLILADHLKSEREYKPVQNPDGSTVYVRNADLGGRSPVLTSDQHKAQVALKFMPGATPEQSAAYIGADPKNPRAAKNYFVPGTNTVGRTMDDITDITTKAPLAPNAQLVDAANPSSASVLNPGAPSPTIVQDLQRSVAEGKQFDDLIMRADALVASDPTIVGMPGVAQRVSQNAVAMMRDVATALGNGADISQSVDNIRMEAQKAGVAGLLPELFKPQISELEAIHGVLVYKTAASLFGQSGRSATDKDIAAARHVLGDPSSLFESSQALRAKLGVIRQLAAAKAANSEAMLRQWSVMPQGTMQPTTSQSAPTMPPTASQPTQPVRRRWDPANPDVLQ